jgi:hypothetical protein
MSDTAKSRRIFLSFGEDKARQIFSVSQNQNDGSIYFSSPNFGDMDWLMPRITPNDPPTLLSFKSGDQGKLSLHGSGVTHVRPHDSNGNNEFSIKGSTLKDSVDDSLGLRHLVTYFFSDPSHSPVSPAGSRKTDYIISTAIKEPYVLIFWAIPLIGPHSVKIHWDFKTDDLDTVPPKAGWGGFSLIHHGIVWFMYRTKYMDKWPLSSQACYQDGYIVPLLIGTGVGEFRLELRKPVISFEGTEFTIIL